VLFDVDGQRLFAGTHNVLKVFSCPSAACLDSVSVSWGSVVDMARTHTYLVCFSCPSVIAVTAVAVELISAMAQ